MGALQRPQNNNSAVEGQSITRVIAGSSPWDPPSNARSEKGRKKSNVYSKSVYKKNSKLQYLANEEKGDPR